MKRLIAVVAALALAASSASAGGWCGGRFGGQAVVVNGFGGQAFVASSGVAYRPVQVAVAAPFNAFAVQPQVFAVAPQRVVVQRNVNVAAVGAQAVGNQRAVVRTGGLRGLLFGDVSRAR